MLIWKCTSSLQNIKRLTSIRLFCSRDAEQRSELVVLQSWKNKTEASRTVSVLSCLDWSIICPTWILSNSGHSEGLLFSNSNPFFVPPVVVNARAKLCLSRFSGSLKLNLQFLEFLRLEMPLASPLQMRIIRFANTMVVSGNASNDVLISFENVHLIHSHARLYGTEVNFGCVSCLF